jgi:hypothetical protein
MGNLIVLEQHDIESIGIMLMAETKFEETVVTMERLLQLIRDAEEKALQPHRSATSRVMSQEFAKSIKANFEQLWIASHA